MVILRSEGNQESGIRKLVTQLLINLRGNDMTFTFCKTKGQVLDAQVLYVQRGYIHTAAIAIDGGWIVVAVSYDAITMQEVA